MMGYGHPAHVSPDFAHQKAQYKEYRLSSSRSKGSISRSKGSQHLTKKVDLHKQAGKK